MGVTVNPISGGGLSAPINAVDIADGSVSNTEFQYLNGVTSNIQTQIDGIGGGGWDEQTLTSNVTLTNTTTLTNVSGFSFDLEANSTYIFSGEILVTNGNSAVGLDIYLTNSNSDNLLGIFLSGFLNSSSTAIKQLSFSSIDADSLQFVNSPSAVVASPSRVLLSGGFDTGSNTPNVVIQSKLNGSATGVITFFKGSTIKFKKVT